MVKEVVNQLNDYEKLGFTDENVEIIASQIDSFIRLFSKTEYVYGTADLLIVPVEKENDKQEIFVKATVSVDRKTKFDANLAYTINLERMDLDEFLDQISLQVKEIENGKIERFE